MLKPIDYERTNEQVYMIYANRTEDDILLRPELDVLAAEHPQRFHLHYILSQPQHKDTWLSTTAISSDKPATSTSAGGRSVGRVTAQLIKQTLPAGGPKSCNFALLCGPEGFMHEACTPALLQHGYTSDSCVYF